MEDVILLQNKKFFIVGKLVPESGIQIKDGQKANSKSVVVIYQNYLKFIELESEDRKHKKMVVLSKEINPHGNVIPYLGICALLKVPPLNANFCFAFCMYSFSK